MLKLFFVHFRRNKPGSFFGNLKETFELNPFKFDTSKPGPKIYQVKNFKLIDRFQSSNLRRPDSNVKQNFKESVPRVVEDPNSQDNFITINEASSFGVFG